MPKGGSTAPAGRKIISTRKARLLCTAALVLVQVGAAVPQEITVPQPENITLDSDNSELNIRNGGSIEKVTPVEKDSSAVLSIGRNNKVLIEVDGKILNEAKSENASGGFVQSGNVIRINQTTRGIEDGEAGTTITNSGQITGGTATIVIRSNAQSGPDNLDNVAIINQSDGSIEAAPTGTYAIVGLVNGTVGNDASVINEINQEGTIAWTSLSANRGIIQNGVDAETGQLLADNTVDSDGDFVSSTATIRSNEDGVAAFGARSQVFNHGAIIGETGSGVTSLAVWSRILDPTMIDQYRATKLTALLKTPGRLSGFRNGWLEAAVLIIPTPGRSLCGSSAGWAVSHPSGRSVRQERFRKPFLLFDFRPEQHASVLGDQCANTLNKYQIYSSNVRIAGVKNIYGPRQLA